jgi:hypothetical protein
MTTQRADQCILQMALTAERLGLVADFLGTARFMAWLMRADLRRRREARNLADYRIRTGLAPLIGRRAPSWHIRDAAQQINAGEGAPLLAAEVEAIAAEEVWRVTRPPRRRPASKGRGVRSHAA